MPFIDNYLFKKRFQKKVLRIELDENDSVYESLKNALIEHNISQAKLFDASGKLNSGVIQFLQKQKIKNKKVNEFELIRVSGNLKLSFNELFGSIKVSGGPKPLLSGTLLSGNASKGLVFKLFFLEELPENENSSKHP